MLTLVGGLAATIACMCSGCIFSLAAISQYADLQRSRALKKRDAYQFAYNQLRILQMRRLTDILLKVLSVGTAIWIGLGLVGHWSDQSRSLVAAFGIGCVLAAVMWRKINHTATRWAPELMLLEHIFETSLRELRFELQRRNAHLN
jgi:hypothetical protein